MESGQFKTEIEKLNRRSTVERALDDFLIACLMKDADFRSPYEATKELLKRYMAVVRSMKWTPKTGQQFKWDTVTRNGVNHDRDKKAQRSPAGVQSQGGA